MVTVPKETESSIAAECKMLINGSYMSHARENLLFLCKQQRRRSAFVSGQSDQHFCCLLPELSNTFKFNGQISRH